MSSLFGGATANNNQQGGTGLFGSATNTNAGNTGASLFGSSTAQNNSGGGGLFDNADNNTQNQNQGGNTGGGLFNNSNGLNQTGNTGGLFGSSTVQNQNQNQTGNTGPFGTSTTQNKPATGLFGSAATTNKTTGGGGLFGASTTQNQNQTAQNNAGGLFGARPNTGVGGGMFNHTNENQNQNQNQSGGLSSIFGNTQQNNTQNQNAGGSLFGAAPLIQSQQQQQQNLSGSMWHQPTVQVGHSGHTMSSVQLQKLQMGGVSQPNEKSIKDQITTVWKKWNPDGDGQNPATTTLKTYLYNAVPKEYAPFFYPNVSLGEDEQSWEEALSQKPDPPKVDGQEVATLAYVPIMCKGFEAMGRRVETQAKIVEEMRVRLHEMNNSLSAVMDAHQQRMTVRIETAKKQHQVLSQRCLRLAVKVQVLRNRGYALDAAEEGLRKTLIALEKRVMDPGSAGREDEIWARMVTLRERTSWLEEEGKRVTAQVDQQTRQGQNPKANGVPESVLAKTKEILKDYDEQLQHLNKELEDVKNEYAEWDASQRRR
ncbi:Nucleoporin NUP57 [Fulvia fulva]|nr:Nucleoporin NUP57 [Fulvia fulva]KAK4632848.1 Nucleoporin NUP57 [Fulvia fulva]WPV11469.1 Nucleoporin NUP57 [Fulvia fulva]WPV25775.1 Nucleoporin NUP57 [Fulvia fulva]